MRRALGVRRRSAPRSAPRGVPPAAGAMAGAAASPAAATEVSPMCSEEEIVPRNLEMSFSVADEDGEPRAAAGAAATGATVDDSALGLALPSAASVVVRVKPAAPEAAEECIRAVSATHVECIAPAGSASFKAGERSAEYRFSRTYGPATGQREFYDAVAAPMVRSLVERGESGVLMAYGITGSGKTHTTVGTKQAPGLVPSALMQVFESLPRGCCVALSLYEIYNERIGDLLAPGADGPSTTRPGSARLRLCERADGRVVPRGITELRFEREADATAAVRRALAARAAGRTALNKESSRSHAVFTITVVSAEAARAAKGPEQSAPAARLPRLAFVDLAGSERAHRTGASGARLLESSAINASLMTLGRCFEALRHNQARPRGERRLVPYRESKVTHLFRDAFHGQGALALLVCVSPDAADYDETQHVLRYAAVAAKIKTMAEIGVAPKAGTLLDEVIEEAEEEVEVEASEEDPMETAPTPANKRKREVLEEDAIQEEGDDEANFGGELDPQVDVVNLRSEVDALRQRLYEAEAAAARIESEVREEVSAEMAELIKAMEENYAAKGAKVKAAVRKGRSTNAFERRLNGLNEDEEDAEDEADEVEEADESDDGIEIVDGSDEEEEGDVRAAQGSTRKRSTRRARPSSQAAAALLAETVRARAVAAEQEAANLREEKALAERRAAEHRAAAEAAEAEAAKLAKTAAEAREAMQRALEEERTQMEANAAMEREVLEEQLRRQKEEYDALLCKLNTAAGRASRAAEGRRKSMAVFRAVVEGAECTDDALPTIAEPKAIEAETAMLAEEPAAMEPAAMEPAEAELAAEEAPQGGDEAMEGPSTSAEVPPETKPTAVSPEIIDLTAPTPAPAPAQRRGGMRKGAARKGGSKKAKKAAAGKENASVNAAKAAALAAVECAAVAAAAATPGAALPEVAPEPKRRRKASAPADAPARRITRAAARSAAVA